MRTLTPPVQCSIEPNAAVDLVYPVLLLAGYRLFQTSRERDTFQLQRVVDQLAALGAGEHPAVRMARDLVALGPDVPQILAWARVGSAGAPGLVTRVRRQWGEAAGSAFLSAFADALSDFAAAYSTHTIMYEGQATEAAYAQAAARIRDWVAGKEASFAAEARAFFGDSLPIRLRFVPSFFYEPLGGVTVRGADALDLTLFFWYPYRGDVAHFPMSAEWCYQGGLHFVTMAYANAATAALAADIDRCGAALAGAAGLPAQEEFARWFGRNLFLACRVRVFAQYLDGAFATGLARNYGTTGCYLVPWLSQRLRAYEQGERGFDAFVAFMRSLLGELRTAGAQVLQAELNRPFQGPFGACFNKLAARDPVVLVPGEEERQLALFARALWRKFRYPVWRAQELSPEQVGDRCVIIHGVPHEDALVARLLAAQGIRLAPGSATLAGQTFTGANLRLLTRLPHPSVPKGWVLLFAATSDQDLMNYRSSIYTETFFDFVLYDGNELLTAGHYDAGGDSIHLLTPRVRQALGL